MCNKHLLTNIRAVLKSYILAREAHVDLSKTSEMSITELNLKYLSVGTMMIPFVRAIFQGTKFAELW